MIFRRNRCPHEYKRGIYGDEINIRGGFRLQCLICGLLLDGSVALANTREVIGGRASRAGDGYLWHDGHVYALKGSEQ